uniref:Uncharacterized protein n=1 Tax=Lactuca sativa TaxID=4236 RepID=A0A9R1WX46_LACSA|nr:hypothetical protein LSAT_V11C800421580 [Lactuca sativa]
MVKEMKRVVHKVAFHIEQKYKAKKELKDKVDMHDLETMRNISFTKSDKSRLTTVCDGTVVVNASGVGEPTSRKKINGKDLNVIGNLVHLDQVYRTIGLFRHTIRNTFASKHEKSDLVKQHFLPNKLWIIMKLSWTAYLCPTRTTAKYIWEEKAFRAKAEATINVVGDYVKQYGVLRDYVLELQKTNEGTTVKIDVVFGPIVSSPARQFKRIYLIPTMEPTHWHMLLRVKTLQVGNGFFSVLEKILTCIQIPTSSLSVIDRSYLRLQNTRSIFGRVLHPQPYQTSEL